MSAKEFFELAIQQQYADQAFAEVKHWTGIDVQEALDIVMDFARAYYAHDDAAVLRVAARAQVFYVANGGELP